MDIIMLDQAKQKRYGGLSMALGAFDGLHIGHMALIDAVRQGPGQSAALTFDTLPGEYFHGDKRPRRLFTYEEKLDAFEAAGIDVLCMAHFDKDFAAISSDGFTSMLKDCFSPAVVVAGYNYTYGRHAGGDAQSLMEAGEALGFAVRIIPPVIAGGAPVSSSRIRVCLESGDVAQAALLLGRAYALCGRVGSGRGIGGTKLGFPTANLYVPEEKLIPRSGVYSVEIDAAGGSYRGVCNIGVNPTVSDGGQKSIEIHILSLSADLYGRHITARFLKRLRDEKKFRSIEELKDQIKRDIESL